MCLCNPQSPLWSPCSSLVCCLQIFIKNIAISSKIRLMRSLAMSIFLYACETWTITVDTERRIQALEMRCFHKLLGILYRDNKPMRKWKPELETPSGLMTTSWPQWKDANWSGTSTSHDHLDWPRLFYREQFKEEGEEANRGNDGKTTSKSGLALNGISYYGKLRTTRSGGSWL